jgi:hypothetical protein
VPIRLKRKDVFITGPFDASYKPIFDGLVFAVYHLGFVVRCALEVDDSSQVRFEKITKIIGQCAFGIHDISSVALGKTTNLPRFNMPLELGLYLGCQRFGSQNQRRKACLILDSDQYRYRNFISDISGQDVHAHNGRPLKAIKDVRDWLSSVSKTKALPGGAEIAARYTQFRKDLPEMCKDLKRKPTALTFLDYSEMVKDWLTLSR